ncbi:ran-binding protein 3-like [Sceloporus undulatus]|uniref:ran-binding protein 3-like n=1 Tax=Sceloporus undulatus TaxID=8520 RepID=UPI001C4D837B|nr:ran-binding protein 3-like [Sceloporus undulatus]
MVGHPKSPGKCNFEGPVLPASRIAPVQPELAGRLADGSSPEDGEESDREDGGYCPPVKRERTSSLTQFPPSQPVTKNNVFMPSSFCEPSAGNSDSEPGELLGQLPQ